MSNTSKIIGAIVVIIIGLMVIFNWNSITGQPGQSPTPMMTPSPLLNPTVNSTSTATSTGGMQSTTTATSTTSSNKPYTTSQVATHNSGTSCWSIVNGNVYDLTNWIGKHPGGADAILSLCGKDGTQAFTAQHGGQQKQEATLATFKIGVVAK